MRNRTFAFHAGQPADEHQPSAPDCLRRILRENKKAASAIKAASKILRPALAAAETTGQLITQTM